MESVLCPSGGMYTPARDLYSLIFSREKEKGKERQEESVRSRKSERPTESERSCIIFILWDLDGLKG